MRLFVPFVLCLLGTALSPAGAMLPGTSVTLTAYSPGLTQTDSSPELSACGRTGARGAQVAVSRDLRQRYPCGSVVQVYRPDTHHWHRYTVWDTLNARYRLRVDLMMQTAKQARQFGVQGGAIRQ